MKFLNDIQLNKNQIINLVLHNNSTEPSAPKEGQTFYHTTAKNVKYWDGTEWVVLANYLAGTGLTATPQGNEILLSLNVDDSTVEIDSDTLRIKAQGVGSTQLKDSNVTTIKLQNQAVTFTKIQDFTTMTILGSVAGGTPEMIGILDDSDFDAEGGFKIPTVGSVRAFVDSRIADLGTQQGGFDASVGVNLPGSGTTINGDYWYVTAPGIIQSVAFNIGDLIIANQSPPTLTNPNHYTFLESNRDQATVTVLGLVKLATNAEVQAGVNTVDAITPAGLSSRTATETRTGLQQVATQAEVDAGTNDTDAITPLKLKTLFDAKIGAHIADLGDGSSFVFAVSHPFNTINVEREVIEIATGETVWVDTARTDVNTVTVTFGSNNIPTNSQYRLLLRKAS